VSIKQLRPGIQKHAFEISKFCTFQQPNYLWQKSLSQQLLHFASHHQIDQATVRVLDVCVAECAQSQVRHGAVVEDLGGGVRVLDSLLQVRHQHQVTRLKPVVVQRVMVDVAQDGPRAQTICVVFSVHILAHFVQQVYASHSVGRNFALRINSTILVHHSLGIISCQVCFFYN
jgi:hypothetical protein